MDSCFPISSALSFYLFFKIFLSSIGVVFVIGEDMMVAAIVYNSFRPRFRHTLVH